MKQHRFFINHKITDNTELISISDLDIIHQVKDVLRLKIGDSIILLDGSGIEYHGRIKDILKKELIISKVLIKDNDVEFNRNIVLASSLIKKDKYEWVLQKGTEIGVSRFVPIISKRTEKIKLNIDRAKKIVKEAAEQSERGTVPDVSQPVSLEEFLMNNNLPVICFNKNGEKFEPGIFKDLNDVVIFTGPEGGFSEEDISLFKENNAKFISLGDQILRAETAAIISSFLLTLK